MKIFRLGPFHPDSGGNSYYYHERHLASGFGLILDQGEPAYMYWLSGCVIEGDTFGIVTSISGLSKQLPTSVRLYQNYPNPFNPRTTFEFSIPRTLYANLSVYNLLGEKVTTVIDEQLSAGTHRVNWDATGQSSGVYFYRLRTGDFVVTRKLVVLR